MSEDAPHYGPMTEQRAMELVNPIYHEHEGVWQFNLRNMSFAWWDFGDSRIGLDGDFTADELEAIAWWMRNKPWPIAAGG